MWMPDCFVHDKDGYTGLLQEAFDNPPGYPRTCLECQNNEKLKRIDELWGSELGTPEGNEFQKLGGRNPAAAMMHRPNRG